MDNPSPILKRQWNDISRSDPSYDQKFRIGPSVRRFG